ncbi:Hydantoinase/oxoprolinase [Methanohalobium evestigatum Z-7303]|uniref:Hydantoinase/oxoprolinase n=1 Tax=Methanohalobium evestigatum (strain ATCC BAA-1072 / DSM 3721 / NBRC 107634 / OCM 161 / Z-7303) TaxID=644295 RepID=D7E644_METEZ|nr:hydantoinase/oxoprolinase family protein [Methanohalobium evestigatum]ADI73066.1 Hydantoinase/oxoprolinase [Methanohalobium evestigatum Z-7303]
MEYSLGIDAGGTYTDVVIMRNHDGVIVDFYKSLTTYPDLVEGVKNAIDGLDCSYLKGVNIVSVSTTLATNTVLENTGYPVGLVLVGDYEVPEDLDVEHYIVVSGGHTTRGDEASKLDEEKVEDFIKNVKDKVSAFAVSSYFSVRNPDHELRVKQKIKELTDYPVVCGHELSQDLGVYERGITAYLNAQLLPITTKFIDSVKYEIERRGIDAKMRMLKCDGSIVGINEALEKPIELIFSGPSASLMGAAYLTNLDSCAVVDIGGTSTDVSLMENGLPELVDTGAVVGGWQTKVRALRMETSAMGGDSHVWVKNQTIRIGPRRVTPLCVAAETYPGLVNKLKKERISSSKQLTENIQPTKFYVKTREKPVNLTESESRILELIENNEPASINEIFRETFTPDIYLNSLIQKRLIQPIGFTPTDALHILGDYEYWNINASHIGATLLSRLVNTLNYKFCGQVKDKVTHNLALNLTSFVLKNVDRSEIDKILHDSHLSKIKILIPLILIGASAQVYQNNLKKSIDADIRVPEFAEVGNAVGAIAGKGVKRVYILIKSVYDYENNMMKAVVFSPGRRDEFYDYDEALEFTKKRGHELIFNYMDEAGLDKNGVKIEMNRDDISMDGSSRTPVETNLVFVGVWNINYKKSKK